MIRIGDSSEACLNEIAAVFAEAFLAEDGIIRRSMSVPDAEAYFRAALKEYIRIGALYAADGQEGYCVYHHKKQGVPWYREILLMIRMMRTVSSGAMQKMVLLRRGWQDYTLDHMHDRDYIDVPLLAVRKEDQGKGFMRKLLEEPFREAEKHGIACILDTDSEVKAAKYMHLGMVCEKEMILQSGLHMYTLSYGKCKFVK
ncbi:MAG: GNAT family N-acetyltransferase [Solobacterium sp.]|nr:GNAT family N-acetyltransferase [Solobacterium sp.]